MCASNQTAEQASKTGERVSALRYILGWSVAKKSLIIALVVGCVLSVANQFDVILREPLNARLAAKIFMNFVIPFVVASISAVANRKGR